MELKLSQEYDGRFSGQGDQDEQMLLTGTVLLACAWVLSASLNPFCVLPPEKSFGSLPLRPLSSSALFQVPVKYLLKSPKIEEESLIHCGSPSLNQEAWGAARSWGRPGNSQVLVSRS